MAYTSAFVKRDERTTHEKWCDKMVSKAHSQRVRSVRVAKKPDSSFKRYNYSNLELKEMFEKCLTN